MKYLISLAYNLKRPLLNHWFAITIFLAACALHFWYVILHMDTALYGGPGDHTAGIIWLYEQYPQNPWWHMTDAAGFPFPQNLWSPVYVVSQGFYILYWLFAKVFGGAVAGYNMIVFAFLGVSYAAVYLACLRVTKAGKVLSSLLSYGVVFSTFSLACIAVGHISYLLAPAWSVALILCTTRIYTQKNTQWWIWATTIALLGGTWMFDPYFILFAWVIFITLTVVLVAYRRTQWRTILKRFALIGVLSCLLFAPVVIYGRIHQGAITQSTSSIRNSIDADLIAYSARIEDYFLPAFTNPLLPHNVAELKANSFHNSLGFTLFIGIVPLLVFIAYTLARILGKIKTESDEHEKLYLIICGAVVLVLFALSLPPHVEILGHTVLLPSGIMEQFVSMWRVVARAYIFLMPPLMLIVGIFTSRILKAYKLQQGAMVGVYILIGLLTTLSFLGRNPFDQATFWNIKASLPVTYEKIAKDSSIKVVAEYPLREQPHYRGSLYFTAQLYHHKKLFNSYQATTNEGLLRESLMDLNNPQTIPTLRYLGVDTLQVWRNNSLPSNDSNESLAQIKKIASTKYTSMFSRGDTIDLYAVKPKADAPANTFVSYFNVDSRPGDDRITDIWQGTPQYFEMGIYDLCQFYWKPVCRQRQDISNMTLNQHLKIRNIEKTTRYITERIDGVNQRVYTIEPGQSEDITISRSADVKQLIGFMADQPGGIEMAENYITIE